MGNTNKRYRRKKNIGPCFFCREKIDPDYKDPVNLKRFITPRGKILAAARSGVCARHQRRLREAILRARFVAFLAYVEQPA